MATPKLLKISKLLRYCQPIQTISSSSSSFRSLCIQSQHLTNTSRNRTTNSFKHTLHFSSSHFLTAQLLVPFNFSCYSRPFSTRDSDLGFGSSVDGYGGSEIAEALVSVSDGEELTLPVRAVISFLDGYHDLTGLPWWIIITSFTLALRIALFPLLIFQLNKIKRIVKLFPKLPPPLPPPLSGRSYKDQITLFWKERRAVGCPSYLWFLAYISIQFPCFFLWMTTIRRMSLAHHSGFDFGGTLWFKNLTEFPHGVLGTILPLLIAGLHFVNVQVSFRTSSVGKATGLFASLARYYRFYLEFFTLPIFFIGFCVPQGSLVYWITNSSLTLIQQISLNYPHVRQMLGLPDKKGPVTVANPQAMGAPGVTLLDSSTKQRKISFQNLTPRELLALSVQFLAEGHKDRAIPLLRLALDKDPEYVRALVVMGQTLLQKGLDAEATEYLECAISKLFFLGHSTEVEDADLLIQASQWAGAACVRQGKIAEGIVHLERIADMKESEDSKSKVHYYEGLVMLASALYNGGHKAEALKYLRKAAAYNSAYNVYLEQCEKDKDSFVSDLVNSRRGDY